MRISAFFWSGAKFGECVDEGFNMRVTRTKARITLVKKAETT